MTAPQGGDVPPSQRRTEGSLLPFGLALGLVVGAVVAVVVERLAGG